MIATFETYANQMFPRGCTCPGTNSGGDCEWCQCYHNGPEKQASVHKPLGKLMIGSESIIESSSVSPNRRMLWAYWSDQPHPTSGENSCTVQILSAVKHPENPGEWAARLHLGFSTEEVDDLIAFFQAARALMLPVKEIA